MGSACSAHCQATRRAPALITARTPTAAKRSAGSPETLGQLQRETEPSTNIQRRYIKPNKQGCSCRSFIIPQCRRKSLLTLETNLGDNTRLKITDDSHLLTFKPSPTLRFVSCEKVLFSCGTSRSGAGAMLLLNPLHYGIHLPWLVHA